MDLFTREDLETLAHTEGDVCISLFMPMYRVEAEQEQNGIRYKNLLRDTQGRLREQGRRPDEIEVIMKPAQDLLNRQNFWRHLSDGLAAFITPSSASFYRLPVAFEELVAIGPRFHLKPLFPLIAANNRFFVLALSQNQVALYQGTHEGLSEVKARELPKSLQEALFTDDPERSVQSHTANRVSGNSTAMAGRQDMAFHGQGVQDEDQRRRPHDALLRFFHQVDEGVREALHDETAPLVLAGVEYYLPLYRKVNRYKHLIEDDMVTGNPDHIAQHELHEKAWAVVEPRFTEAQTQAIETFKQARARKDDLASEELREIVPAAVFGQVGTLFVPVYQHVWGKYDAEANTVEINGDRAADDIDLLNLAAVHTYLNGGEVHALRDETMPVSSPLAARFRYPADVQAEEVR